MNDSPAADADHAPEAGVRVTTGSRLHFGLLDTAPPFGGIGVMITQPSTRVLIRAASQFTCCDQIADRVQPIAHRLQRFADWPTLPACEILMVNRAPAHRGLGSGTQLAMAIAEGLSRYARIDVPPEDLAVRIANRGKRSAVGVHGYFQGGLIYEEAQAACDLNPIQSRGALPDDWCVGLFQPALPPPQVSGDAEQRHFKSLAAIAQTRRQALRSIVTDQLLPAAQRGCFADFAAAVQAYNLASGRLFESVQGGPYNGPEITNLVARLIACGAAGVGQSSWGPSVFAWFPNGQQAQDFVSQLPADIEVWTISNVLNSSRELIG